MKNSKSIFFNGAITPEFIAVALTKHQSKHYIGAHDIFIGQVRKDKVNELAVQAIEYSAFEEMAEAVAEEIREKTFQKFNIACMHIVHSLGRVNAGGFCFFVFVSSRQRKEAFEACEYVVEQCKKHLPVWGKEILTNDSHTWKTNF